MSPEQLAEAFAHQARRWSRTAGSSPAAQQRAFEIARQLSLALTDGHTCLPLQDLGQGGTGLAATGIVGAAATPGSHPLVQDDDGRLYLHRYFDYEQRLARRLAAACTPAVATPLTAAQQVLLAPWLRPAAGAPGAAAAGAGTAALDWQVQAAALALLRRFTLVSGGPGTGKTSAVVRLLACLLTLDPAIRIVLAAPTGKAAARMQQAVLARAGTLPPDLRACLPDRAMTLHRLLGAGGQAGQGARVQHDADHPLALDVLVVDEASMLDLALATRVFEAVPAHARIILLGDKDQLAAVQSGAVFAELSRVVRFGPATASKLAALTGTPLPPDLVEARTAADPAGGLHDSVVWFTRQYRFAADAPIGQLAAAVRQGDAAAAFALLKTPGPALVWQPQLPAAPDSAALDVLAAGFAGFWAAVESAAAPAAVLAAFDGFRVLSAQRGGAWGAQALNAAFAAMARSRVQGPGQEETPGPWFKGRPVLILRNDAVLGLFNGDIGVVLPNAEGELQACFEDAGGTLRWIAPVRLPEHESAYAMTIHKSQGSEFARVAVILPPDGSAGLTRELLYTGITRARDQVLLQATAERVGEAIARPTERRSGLLARLAEALAAPGSGNGGIG